MRGVKLTFDESLSKYKQIQNLNELAAEKKANLLIKVSVPCKWAIDILKYCDAYTVNAATIFRGISGGAMYVQEDLEIMEYKKLVNSKEVN